MRSPQCVNNNHGYCTSDVCRCMCHHPEQESLFDPVSHARSGDPDTSKDAAKRKSDIKAMRNRLLSQFVYGAWLTAEEASDAAGYTPADGAWKRVSDLLGDGLLVDTGERRKGRSGRAQRVLRLA